MADGSTSTYSLILPEVDGAEGTWGTSINTNLTNLDSLLSGGTALTAIVVDNIRIDGSNIGLTGDTDLITLTSNNVAVAGTLTATALSGPLTGDVTGTLQTAAQTNITSVGNLTALNVDGSVTADALTMGDNEKITLGAGSDFEIYHDPDHSIIKEGNASGNLKIQGQNINIQNAAGTKNFIHTDSNQDVRLSFDGSTKLQTTTGGIDVTGTVTANGLSLGDDHTITLGASDDLTITHKSSNGNSTIKETGSGNLILQADDLQLDDTNSNKFIKCVEGGAVQLFHNQASHATSKLATTATGIDVNGTLTADGISVGDGENISLGDSNELVINHAAGGGSTITETGSGNLALIGNAVTIENATGTNEYQIVCDGDGVTNKTKLYYGQPSDTADFKLGTTTSGVEVKGTVTADALTMGDNEKITLGAGGDLEIYSDGATSFITQPSGATGSDNLVIKGENVFIKNDAGQELIGTFSDVARLSNQGNVKLVTQTTGVQITGNLKLIDSSDNITTIEENASENITLTLPSATGTLALTASPTFTGTVTADAYTGHMTSVVTSSNQTIAETSYGVRKIHTGGAVTYTFDATGTISGTAIGKSIVIVNAGTDTITCNFTTSKFYVMTSGNNADVSGSGASSFTILKGSIAEVVITETNKALVFGSGI